VKARILAAFRGQERLVIVFWAYYVGLGFIMGMIAGIFFGIASETGHTSIGVVSLIFILLPYYLWAMWSLWACAFNAQWKGWGYVVRGIVLLSIAGSVVRALN
jgi:hypothetical protein